jgi:hypothetical protein
MGGGVALHGAGRGAVAADVGANLDESGAHGGQAVPSHTARRLATRVIPSVAGTGSEK